MMTIAKVNVEMTKLHLVRHSSGYFLDTDAYPTVPIAVGLAKALPLSGVFGVR
jgi:hypothetical protein